MDPFNEVKDDAWAAVDTLESLLRQHSNSGVPPSPDAILDFNNNYQELQEICEDLKQAISISESQPDKFRLSSSDIDSRKAVLADLQSKIVDIKSQWHSIDIRASSNGTPTGGIKPREITTMSNRISQDDENSNPENPFNEQFNQFQQQEMIQEQDVQLDSIHQTMKNLNQQAALMGNELEEQGFMLDELDEELDHVDNRLQRGMKRINVFIEKNRERGSDWCIGILVVALCILLILVIAV
ncbi:member of the syntaxin family of t-snares [Scheffersomyces xylosifermentans]|uniref:member of the syntaxin family of t-snares n=1 Tax=Scheffersomyces xylosifermentans TaxID=1304137 RepID=UPI00315C5BF5